MANEPLRWQSNPFQNINLWMSQVNNPLRQSIDVSFETGACVDFVCLPYRTKHLSSYFIETSLFICHNPLRGRNNDNP